VNVAGLLPHEGRARFVTSVLELDEGRILCEGAIPTESPLARDGFCPTFVGLELAAQGAALLEASRPARESAPALRRLGYLVRASGVQLGVSRLPVGRPLRAAVRRVGAAPPLHVYEVRVTLGREEALRGRISTFLEAQP
jgi:predicted hotdog family 3-hydroxylacyl-ACP dehydratase